LVNEGAGERVSWFCDAAATEGVNFPKRSSVI
jgi:6-phosphogluconolactonase